VLVLVLLVAISGKRARRLERVVQMAAERR
jgi:hypothetical protein